MADPGPEVGFGDDDGRALQSVVYAGGDGGMEVYVFEAGGEVGSDLHPGDPGGKRGVARVLGISEAVVEAGAGGVLVD